MEIDVIVTKVKDALRVSSTNEKIISEIKDCVNECLEDLKRSGISYSLEDPLILKACKCYAKANYGFENDSDKYYASYKMIKNELILYPCHNKPQEVIQNG
ncbi:phage head-tail connector protein [Anaerorhabdus sp.]|uniref:phage head-tail connector protein n=1 Tax=Anaerorhabdus sp. TaxID=1872524 RepID=UPI002FCC57D7